MRCRSCQTENVADARFCEECAAPLEASCPSCGATNRATAKFCRNCSASLGTHQPARSRGPSIYTPKHLAEKILTSRAALEGERKQVTVLFADVKGSMELAEQLDPEEWHRILDRFFQILTDGVHRFEGTVNQYTGDGIMALFGAPIAHENHAHRACYAALKLRDEARSYADELRLERGLSFSVRMGLNSGEVVVGKIGDDLRMDYTAQGHTVGLAARMEQLAEPGSVFLTDTTARLVDGFFQLRDLGVSTLKGVREPLRVHVLEGLGRLRTRLDLSLVRGLSRFVGRASETRTLELALEKALAGNGQVIGAVGEPGVGKSRLCYEFVERCRGRGLTVYQAHCVAHGKLLPLTPVLELLREIFGIRADDDAREARRKIAGTLVLLAEEVREMLPLVFDMLGVADPEQPQPPMDPEVRQRRIFEFNKRMMRARSAREPALIFVDDLHWIDAASDAYLANWVEAIRGTRTIMLVNFRPEYRAPWMATSYYQQLPLQPLGPDAIDELLSHLLGTDPSVKTVAALVRERAGGNPFFVEEIVQGMVETGRLAGTRGAYRCIAPVDALTIPQTVQGVLAARIDRLPEREKSALQAAAVIGRTAAEPLLGRVLDLETAKLEATLQSLVAGEFLTEEALYPEMAYAFKHPLTREVAYASLLHDRRQRTHAAVARAMAETVGTELDARAALVAHHFESAGEAEEAASWHDRAGEWAAARDVAGAVDHWRRAWNLCREQPLSPRGTKIALSACSSILWLGYRGALSRSELDEIFEAGSAFAEKVGDSRTLAFLKLRYHFANVWAGQSSAGTPLAAIAEAKQVADELGDRELKLAALVSESSIRYIEGRPRDGLEAADAALAFLGDDTGAIIGGLYAYPRLLLNRATALTFLGRIAEAEREWARLFTVANEVSVRDPEACVLAHAGWVQVSDVGGWSPDEALTHARLAVELVERGASPLVRGFAYNCLGHARLLQGDAAEALPAAERGREIGSETWMSERAEIFYLALIARASLAMGDLERARDTAAVTVGAAAGRANLLGEVGALHVQASVLIRLGGSAALTQARASLLRALAIVQETGGRALEPHVYERFAELARAEGDAAAAERELRTAHRLFVEMGIRRHAERLAQELGL